MALTIGQKAGWGVADMGVVVFVVVKQLLVLAFLSNYLGVPIALAGAVTTAVLLFDILSDPLIGFLSDRTTSRFGRRAPWMFLGAPVLVAGMTGLFAVPQGFSLTGNLAWVTGFFVLATIGFTMIAVPYGAQAGEFTQDPRERSAMTGFRMGFASVGILIGGALIPLLAGDTREGFVRAALAVSPLIVGAVWLSLWSTRSAPRIETPASVAFLPMWRLVLSNRAFVVLTVLYGVMTLAVAILTAGLPFAAIYLIADGGTSPLSGVANGLGVLSLLFAGFVLGAILSQPVWVLLSGRLGKTGALVVGLVLYIGLLLAFFAALPSENVTAVFAMMLLVGMTNGAYQQIPWAMYPDLMALSRVQSGQATEGAYSALWLFGQKTANALAPLLLGLILSVFGWQETTQGATVQSEVALAALRACMTFLPAAILALSIAGLLGFYRPQATGA